MNSNWTKSKLIIFRSFICIILAAIASPAVYAQTGKPVSGVLQDSTGLSVISASVRLTSSNDTLQAITDIDGKFSFPSVKASSFTLSITSIGYETITRNFTIPQDRSNLVIPTLTMKYSSQVLGEVTVTGGTLVTMKGDTTEYNAADYRVRDNAMVDELVKKLDGVEVGRDGTITAQGETVSRVRVNGRDFFGGDVQTAMQNLPADIIEKLQIIDDYGDQANLTGNRSGDPERILNIVIAEDKNKGYLGRFGAGGGTEDRYQVGGMFRVSNNKTEVSLVGDVNNNNNQAFNFNTRGSGARRMPSGGGATMGGGGAGAGGGFGGGGAGGGMGAFGGGGGANGLTDAYSIGLNVRSDINEKLTTYGNYSFSYNDNAVSSIIDQTENFRNEANEDLSYNIINNTSAFTNTERYNHRFDWNVEYKASAKSFIKLSPTLSLAKSNTMLDQSNLIFVDTSARRTQVFTTNLDNSTVPNYGISGLYNYRIDSKGRNAFVNFSLNRSKTDDDQDRLNTTFNNGDDDAVGNYLRQLVDINNKGLNGGVSFSYIEPLNTKSNLELTYDYNFANYDNSRITDSIYADGSIVPAPMLSNDFEYTFATHRTGLTYRYRTDKTNFQLGATVMPTLLNGTNLYLGENINTSRNGFYVVPVFRYEYKATNTKIITAEYNGTASEPSFSQIQPVLDLTNPQNRIQGNPELNAQFNHRISLRYRNFDFSSGNVFFAMINSNITQDRIVTDITSAQDPELGVVRTTSYLNTGGYYNVNGFYNFSKPFKNRTYVVSFRGRANYTNNVAFTNAAKNTSGNWILNQGVDFQYNPSTYFEVRPGVNYTYNITNSSLGSAQSTNISTWMATLNSNITFAKTFVWGVDFAKTSNSGYGSSVDANPMIINTYIEKQFFKLKNGMLRLSAFDLLNEQVNVGRVVTDTRITDTQSNRLARYFLLSFTYRFQNFGGRSGVPEDENRMRFPGAPPTGGSRPGGF